MSRKMVKCTTESGSGRGVYASDAIMQKAASGEEMKEGLRKVKLTWQNGGKN